MQEILDTGVIDFGGGGKLLLEIEYNNDKGEFKEAIYSLPETCNQQDIVEARLYHLKGKDCNCEYTVMVLHFNKHDAFNIYFPDRCRELVEVRLPEAIGGDNITSLFD